MFNGKSLLLFLTSFFLGGGGKKGNGLGINWEGELEKNFFEVFFYIEDLLFNVVLLNF